MPAQSNYPRLPRADWEADEKSRPRLYTRKDKEASAKGTKEGQEAAAKEMPKKGAKEEEVSKSICSEFYGRENII